MTELYIAMGNRIREIRHLKSLTIQQLADGISIDPSFLGQIERGVGIPSLNTLSRLADYFKVPLKDLFDFEDRKGPSDFLVREATSLLQRRPRKDRERAVKILKELFKP